MGDIVIHRCILRLVRHGGWSWGANPRKLLENATKMLPELIAEKLADLFPDGEDLEITESVRLAVRIRLDDLLKSGGALTEVDSGQPDVWRSTIREAKNAGTLVNKAHAVMGRDPAKQSPPEESIGTALTRPQITFLSFLLNWSERGVLQRMLPAFTAQTLVLWHDHLFSQLPQTGSEKLETILSLARAVLVRQKDVPGNLESWLRLRLTVAIEVLAQQGVRLSSPLLRQVLDQLLPDSDQPDRSQVLKQLSPDSDQPDRFVVTEALPASANAPDRSFAQHVPDTRERQVARTPVLDVAESRAELVPIVTGDVQICSVLPFLVLGVLSRLGYLDVLSATLDAARLENDANHFAIALAHKVLPAPKRGWHREPLARRAAAAFAGVNESLPEAALVSFGRQIAEALSPVDRFIALALADGHNPNQPLLLHRIGKPQDSLMLFDVEGCFLVTWHEELSMMLDTIRDFGPVTVLVTEDAATPVILRKLGDENVRFITAAPPGRGETWRVFHAPSRYWTNDHETPETRLIRMARLLPQSTRQIETFLSELVIERPAIAPIDAPALERSVTLAATAALATIAWTLWHGSESTEPVLALERFADLDGRVSLGSDSVRVRVPLGRRHQDLREHGFLADIPGVPWFGGRVVEFPGI
jgi:hypothetical protein